LTEVVAEVQVRLGIKRTLVVWGEGNLDEMTTTGETQVAEGREGKVTNYTVSPEQFGLTRVGLDALRGGATAAEAAGQVREVLSGTPGPKADIVLLNAGAAMMAAGRVDSIGDGIELARALITSGAAREKLEQLVAFSQAA
jgi:anthranilate phosphoribosyltransferase